MSVGFDSASRQSSTNAGGLEGKAEFLCGGRDKLLRGLDLNACVMQGVAEE